MFSALKKLAEILGLRQPAPPIPDYILNRPKPGEEVAPPWEFIPDAPPWMGGAWRQGPGEWWLARIWDPFWENLSHEERLVYLEKWPPPDDDWHINMTRSIEWLRDQDNGQIKGNEEDKSENHHTQKTG